MSPLRPRTHALRMPMFPAIALACGTTILAAADPAPAPALPPADQAAIDKAVDGNIAKPLKAYNAYLASLDDATAKAVKDLEKLKTEAMKSGNLPLANAVDAEEKTLKSGGLAAIVAWNHVKQDNTDLLGNPTDIKTLIVGAWKVTTSIGLTAIVTFAADDTVSFALTHGKYVIDASKGTVTITWDNGQVDTISKIEPDHMTGAGGNGITYDFVRTAGK